MKAVRFHQHGAPDVLRYEDAPDPVLAPARCWCACARARSTISISGRGAGCRTSASRCRTSPAATSPAKWSRRRFADVRDRPARDAAARAELRPVRGVPRRAATTSARATRSSATPTTTAGTPSSSTCRPQNLVPIPDEIGFVDAAAFPLTFLTAWHMLMTRAQLKRGEDVLVLAAGSGVGQAAIQIAALHGARVIATAGSAEKLERARALGATAVIHHYEQDIAEEIKRLTNRRGVDVVIEHVGEATWPQKRPLAGAGRAARDLRGDHRLPRIAGPARAVREAAVDSGLVHGHQGRAAAGGALVLCRPAEAGDRSHVPAGRGGRRARCAWKTSAQFGKIVLEVQ